MLTSLYRRVIRLHPQAFREKFGDEMLSIFDGAKGTPSAIALLLDAVVSLTRQWGLRSDVWRGLDPSPAQPAPDGVPTFSSLAPFRPRSAAVLEGLLLSLTLFCLTCFAIRYSWIHVLHVRIPEVQFERPTWRPENRSAPTNVSLEETLTTVRQQSPPKVVPSDAPSAASNPTLALPPYSTPAKAKARKRASPASRDTAPVESKDATNSSARGSRLQLKPHCRCKPSRGLIWSSLRAR